MRLNDMLHNILNQNNNVNSTGSVNALPANVNISAQIKALIPGQILQGEVQEYTGDVVKLLLHLNGEDVPLQARLDQNVALSTGKNLLFQVKNNGSSLSLSPLLENMAMGENAAKALESASLPLNENTLQMTTTLMQEGLPINKESLQGIYQEVLANQNAELMDIVDLHKLNMPVTADNLEQIHSYKEMTHQLSAGVNQMSEQLQQLVQDMAANGQGKEAVSLLKDILQFVSQENAGEMLPQNTNVVIKEGTATITPQNVENTIVQSTNTTAQNIAEADTRAPEVADRLLNQLEELTKSDALNQSVTNKGEAKALVQQLLGQLEQLSGDKATFTKVLESPVFKDTLNMLLQDEMLLEPEAAADKEKVKEFFSKLSNQLSNISEALSNVAQEQSPVAKTVQNLSQNVNFLNQMNQMYAYIQLPFKLSETNAHGELYVYSNKRNLAQADGEVSALLHLDMENLGPVDVYVQMKDTNVSTRFYLQDDEMLDFINDHIHILTERLEKRGYHMSCKMTVRDSGDEEGGNVVLKELLNENSNRPALVSYSFDVRA